MISLIYWDLWPGAIDFLFRVRRRLIAGISLRKPPFLETLLKTPVLEETEKYRILLFEKHRKTLIFVR